MDGAAPYSHGNIWHKQPAANPGDGQNSFTRTPSNRIPYIGFLPPSVRKHFVAMCGEFTGTFLFLFFAFSGTQIANTTNKEAVTTQSTDVNKLLYISLCFGFSLAVNAWVFFRVSGGLFNPAVTLGMCLVGALPWLRGGLLLVAQLLGAIATAAVVSVLFPGDLAVKTQLQNDTSVVQGLFIEMFLTAQLVFTIFMLAAEKHKATFIAPVGIGLSLFIAELTGVFFTGGSVNPARSLAPCVVLHSFESYHWIYWIGPGLGAIVAAGFYGLIKKLEYETANPDQDHDNESQYSHHHHHHHDEEKGSQTRTPQTMGTNRSRSLSAPRLNEQTARPTTSGNDSPMKTPRGNRDDYAAPNSLRQHPVSQNPREYDNYNDISRPRNAPADDTVQRHSSRGEGLWVPADDPNINSRRPLSNNYMQSTGGQPTSSQIPSKSASNHARRSGDRNRLRAGSRGHDGIVEDYTVSRGQEEGDFGHKRNISDRRR